MHQEHHQPTDDQHQPMDTSPAETPPAEAPASEAVPAEAPTDEALPEAPPTPAPLLRRRRRQRTYGRWTNPASALQAARFARRAGGREVIQAIRKLCPGHGQGPCKIDLSKLSDYETRARRPGIEHIEAFARYYEKSPEELGLIRWRDQPPPAPQATAPATSNPDPAPSQDSHRVASVVPEQLVDAWLRESAVSIATAVLRALARCPINLTTSQGDPSGDPPAEEPDPASPPR